ncbi:hypothetical protein [Streptomyces sannanensis]|uniref:hypothetical protein n=1 Tax=Streptomyces sannanensis TaxID=285536 RepID=UPI0031E75158
MVRTARRREARSSYRQRRESWYWSSLALVMAPAQREEDTAVSVFFRSARRVSFFRTVPIRTRVARSAR